ncbi:PepSY domain-containing protein [Nonomuraea phyllanthi]|uniref:PepSY domain-containing protein n=1 Tax=Nonomuraea phyllanthi TaxID=2219224 RepID=UPI00188526A2|nr:PepSY domain-containing protein [Nonomuraea phyllanthi]
MMILRALGAAAGATMLAGGCGAVPGEAGRMAAHTPPPLSPAPPATTPPPGGTASPSPGGTAAGASDLRQAARAALNAVPGATLTSIETEENGRVWEVQVVDRDGTEHQMDVESGKVVRGPTTEQEDAADKAKHRDRVAAAKLDYSAAADKILAAVPQGRITELNLDTERGKTVWESDVLTPDGFKHEVAVDAATGAVVRRSG